MRVAFYAPLKPPSHPTPSGDRRIARLLLKALRRGGHDVHVVSTFRSYEGEGNRAKQGEIERRGAIEAVRLLRTKLKRWRPHAWFTYHLYQKAPDWLGPPIAKKLGIPYLVAEAAYAPRRSRGRWDRGLGAVKDALGQADTILMLNPNDEECVAPLVRRRAGAVHAIKPWLHMPEFAAWAKRRRRRPAAIEPMVPFLELGPYRRAHRKRQAHRATIAARHRVPAHEMWLLAVGMMRAGDKLASYRLLANALAGLGHRPWRLLVAGDGPSRAAVRAALSKIERRVHWLGACREKELRPLYAACDLLVWPCINEAIGMAILEAQAAGLVAVAGNVGAVGTIVADRDTGFLVREGDVRAFRRAVAGYLGLPAEPREAMSRIAIAKTGAFHESSLAADQLNRVLRAAVLRARKRGR
jgi:glycosyltransferase involved in cell wall biosynthesis